MSLLITLKSILSFAIDEECYSIVYHRIISTETAEYFSLGVMGWKSGRRILIPVFIRHLVPSIDVVRANEPRPTIMTIRPGQPSTSVDSRPCSRHVNPSPGDRYWSSMYIRHWRDNRRLSPCSRPGRRRPHRCVLILHTRR